MPVDNRSQIWTQVPHKLVRLLRKQHDVFYRSESEVVLNAWDFGKIHFEAINKRADQIFAIYSRVWKEQGNAISPDFRRAIYYKGIVPFLRQSSRAFHRHLTKIDWELHRRYADPLLVGSDFSREWAVARFSDEFDKFMVALRKRWDLKIEIALEQQRLEHSRPEPLFKTLSSDYQKILFRGQRYNIGKMPAAIIALLHKALKEGSPYRSLTEIRSKLGSNEGKIQHWFRGRAKPLWGTLVRGDGEGIYYLNLSEE